MPLNALRASSLSVFHTPARKSTTVEPTPVNHTRTAPRARTPAMTRPIGEARTAISPPITERTALTATNAKPSPLITMPSPYIATPRAITAVAADAAMITIRRCSRIHALTRANPEARVAANHCRAGARDAPIEKADIFITFHRSPNVSPNSSAALASSVLIISPSLAACAA
jgi:hypothetical protein